MNTHRCPHCGHEVRCVGNAVWHACPSKRWADVRLEKVEEE